MAATLALSYAQLAPATQQVFRQSGVFVTDFASDLACAVVAEPPAPEVNTTLRHLLRRNLVMYDRTRARWHLHDLVRDLARDYLESAGETEVVRWRYAHAVVPLAQELHQQYLAGGTHAGVALARFDLERPHLEAAWTWANAHVGTADGARIVLAIALATTHLGELRLDPQYERIPLLEGALKAAQSVGHLPDQGKVLLSLGHATFSVGALRQAIGIWEQARAIFQTLEDRHHEGKTLGNLATAFARLGDLPRAISMYNQALEIFQAGGDQRQEGHARGNLAAAYADLGEAQEAARYLDQALTSTRAAGDRRFEARLLRAQSEVARAAGRLPEAEALCRRALAIAREIGDRQQEGYILMSRGCLATTLDRPAEAASAFDQALLILRDLGDHWGVAECGWHYGLALAGQQRYAHALDLLRASVAYQTAIGHAQAPAHAALLAQLEAEAAQAPEAVSLG